MKGHNEAFFFMYPENVQLFSSLATTKWNSTMIYLLPLQHQVFLISQSRVVYYFTVSLQSYIDDAWLEVNLLVVIHVAFVTWFQDLVYLC